MHNIFVGLCCLVSMLETNGISVGKNTCLNVLTLKDSCLPVAVSSLMACVSWAFFCYCAYYSLWYITIWLCSCDFGRLCIGRMDLPSLFIQVITAGLQMKGQHN